jgi:hypothetical protein
MAVVVRPRSRIHVKVGGILSSSMQGSLIDGFRDSFEPVGKITAFRDFGTTQEKIPPAVSESLRMILQSPGDISQGISDLFDHAGRYPVISITQSCN